MRHQSLLKNLENQSHLYIHFKLTDYGSHRAANVFMIQIPAPHRLVIDAIFLRQLMLIQVIHYI